MEVTWLVMRARSPGLQPLSVIQQDSLFPFCPDCIWAFSQVGIPWHIGTPLLVLDFSRPALFSGSWFVEGCPESASCPLGWLDGFCRGFAALQWLQSQPLPVPSDQHFSFTLPLELISSALQKCGLCGESSFFWP